MSCVRSLVPDVVGQEAFADAHLQEEGNQLYIGSVEFEVGVPLRL